MPKPTKEQLKKLGDNVRPFERTQFDRAILEGEDIKIPFLSFIYDATDNGYPKELLICNPLDILEGNVENNKYLWVITLEGLVIIPEQTPNQYAARGVVCHTNLTEGKMAIQGGELWFGSDNCIYINFKSGRYGTRLKEEREAAIEYFQYVGYKNIKQIR